MSIAGYLSDLAWLEVEADRPVPAGGWAREAVAVFNSAGDSRNAAATESVLAWTEARQGNEVAAQRHLDALRRSASEEGSDTARFTLLSMEARVAGALGDWNRAIELRRETVRIATEWDARGLVIAQQFYLAEALHGAGDRLALEKLTAEILPEVERNGLRGIARDLRALLASPAGKS